MLEERDDEIAMAIELRRSAHDGHHAVGQRQIEQRIDFRIGHPLRQHAERELRLKFRSEALAPPPRLMLATAGWVVSALCWLVTQSTPLTTSLTKPEPLQSSTRTATSATCLATP